MKTYIKNIKSIWKLYKQGRLYSKNYNIYTFMLWFTVKYVKCKLTNTN